MAADGGGAPGSSAALSGMRGKFLIPAAQPPLFTVNIRLTLLPARQFSTGTARSALSDPEARISKGVHCAHDGKLARMSIKKTFSFLGFAGCEADVDFTRGDWCWLY